MYESYISVLLPPLMGYIISQVYCYMSNKSFYKNTTEYKELMMKVFYNVRNFGIGFMVMSSIKPNIVDMEWYNEILHMMCYSLIIEFTFYWIHRWMHMWKGVYVLFHMTHHLETNPSPIDSYVLSVGEALFVVLSGSMPDLVGFPITYRGLFFVKMCTVAFSILNHGGWDGYHARHHQFLKGNYGGSYNFWDYVFGTVY